MLNLVVYKVSLRLQKAMAHPRLEIKIHSFLTSVLNAGCQFHVPVVLTLGGAPGTYLLESWVDGSVGMDICITE
jgi:hypothetical protein